VFAIPARSVAPEREARPSVVEKAADKELSLRRNLRYAKGMTPSTPTSDRRLGQRYFAVCPASIVLPDGRERLAITRDISISGALLLADTSKVKVGDAVDVKLFFTNDADHGHVTPAHVVREEMLPLGSRPWTRRVAVRFDSLLTGHERSIEVVQERTRSIEWIRNAAS